MRKKQHLVRSHKILLFLTCQLDSLSAFLIERYQWCATKFTFKNLSHKFKGFDALRIVNYNYVSKDHKLYFLTGFIR